TRPNVRLSPAHIRACSKAGPEHSISWPDTWPTRDELVPAAAHQGRARSRNPGRADVRRTRRENPHDLPPGAVPVDPRTRRASGRLDEHLRSPGSAFGIFDGSYQ